jgi:pentatricopeptide repeat protein
MAKDCSQAPKSGKDEKPRSAAPPAAKAAKVEPAAAAAAAPPASSESGGTRKCYHCGQSGHMAKDCSEAPKDGAPRTKRPASTEKKDEPSFKERLEAYKATNPAPGQKNFCYLCGKEGHRERDCPKNSKKKDEAKTCLKCGEADHIARYCPTIANRTVYRNEEKPRAEGCYICEEKGRTLRHVVPGESCLEYFKWIASLTLSFLFLSPADHAEECPQLAALQEEFDKFVAKINSGVKLNVKVYDILLEKCAKAMEINGALYLYDQMVERGLEPTDNTHKHLQYLHDRSAKDQSKLTSIPMKPKRVARLKELVTARRVEQRKSDVEDKFLPHILDHLRMAANRTAAEASNSLFELANWLKNASIATLSEPLSAAAARISLATLKGLGRYHQKNKGAEFDLDGDAAQPGRFANKKPKSAQASKKKEKKKANIAKKREAAAAAAAEGGAQQEEEKEEEQPAAPKSKAPKRKETSSAAASPAAAPVAAVEDSSAKQPAAKKQKKASAVESSPAPAPAAASSNGKKKQKTAEGATKSEAEGESEAIAATATATAAAGKKRKTKA